MYYFCTYFDRNYLIKGLALYQSLRQHCRTFKLWVLCMDRECHDILSEMNLPDLVLISLDEFERGDEALLQAKGNRSRIEYYFTCTPSLPLFILTKHSQVDLITYLDADLFFFSSTAPIFDEIRDHSIAIIEHRFPAYLNDSGENGIYNVAWLSFRRDEHGLASLKWWREKCIEWCYDRSDNGRMADQKYLNDWPTRFPGVVVLQHKGANLAPFNIGGYGLRWDGRRVLVEDQPLIFFHFHGFKQINQWIYVANLAPFQVKLSGFIRRHIFEPYIQTLLTWKHRVSQLDRIEMGRSIRTLKAASSRQRLVDFAIDTYHALKSIWDKDFIVVAPRQ
jgi:hypothetical protein